MSQQGKSPPPGYTCAFDSKKRMWRIKEPKGQILYVNGGRKRALDVCYDHWRRKSMESQTELRPEIMNILERASSHEIMTELKRRGFSLEMFIDSFNKAKKPPPKPEDFY